MTDQGRNRLDGWKAIAAHFRRDRTTVMRWAAERGLPVYRMPGGKQSSVFAYEDELRDWIARNAGGADGSAPLPAEDPPQDAPVPPSLPRPSAPPGIARPARGLVLGALMLSGAALLIAFTPIFGEKTGIAAGAPEMPRNALAAADYATARDLWARRTPDDLKQSITLFEAVIARQAGKDSAAMAELDGLATKYPGDATVHNCLAWAKIAAGNITGYAAMTRSMAGAMSTPRWCAACARPTR